MSEFIPGQWVECVEPGDWNGVVLSAGFHRVKDAGGDSADICVEGIRLSWNKRRFRPVEWQVGHTYRTTMESVTATISEIDGKIVRGLRSDTSRKSRYAWWNGTGEYCGYGPESKDVPHLTPYLADDPSPAVETTEARKPAEPKPTTSRYHRTINGATLDLYDIAEAYGLDSHRIFHAVKKLILAGRRGHKDCEQDLREAIVSIESELQKMKGGAS